mgnify:CR=1 FL=1
MKIYLITLRPPTRTGGRYFDSIWVREDHAKERAEQLKRELQRSGFEVWFSADVLPEEWYVMITEAHVNDARLADEGGTE